jgi:hypothetical protein
VKTPEAFCFPLKKSVDKSIDLARLPRYFARPQAERDFRGFLGWM